MIQFAACPNVIAGSCPDRRQPRKQVPGRVTRVPNDGEQAVIREITTMRAQGMSLDKIAAALTARGVRTKTGRSPRWTHQAVARIVRRTNARIGAR